MENINGIIKKKTTQLTLHRGRLPCCEEEFERLPEHRPPLPREEESDRLRHGHWRQLPHLEAALQHQHEQNVRQDEEQFLLRRSCHIDEEKGSIAIEKKYSIELFGDSMIFFNINRDIIKITLLLRVKR